MSILFCVIFYVVQRGVYMIYQRIKELAKKNGISINELEKRIGVARGSLCKIDKHEPKAETIEKLAKELSTTGAYILTGEEKTDVPMFDAEHVELISLYSQLKKEQKETILNLLRSFAQ